jgi:predicted transposase/invertase (TIGR01784 family)
MISEQEKQGIAAFYREEGYQEGVEKGREEGREEGIGEGMKMGKLAVAKALLANGIAREVIVSCTGLTEEQLKAL